MSEPKLKAIDPRLESFYPKLGLGSQPHGPTTENTLGYILCGLWMSKPNFISS